MRKQHKLNILAVSIAAGSSLLLAACGGGSNSAATGGGQNLTGAAISAKNPQSLFSSNSCLTGNVDFSGTSAWYVSGTVDIKNTCNSEQSLAGQTISFTSQDSKGNAVAMGTLNNWWLNNTSYQLIFKAGNGNQQIADVTAGNGNPIIAANQTITFQGGINLTGNTFDNATAQSSFAINGASPTPTPTPTPSPTPTPTPTPTPPPVTTGSLNVVVDTSAAGCTGTTVCNGLSVNVTNSAGTSVANFTVPAASLGGTYTQPISNLNAGSYTVAGSTIASTTVTYTPNATPSITAGNTSNVTIKYSEPVVTTGKATINLASVVPNYTGNLQVQILNTKASSAVVNTYTIKQGASFTTEDLPVTDSTHAYVVKMTTGIADPLQGLYYVESGLPALKITKGQTTSLAVPMKASTIAKKNVTVAISGMSTGDTAGVTFSDAANKYSYVNYTNLANSSSVYKIESGLNLGTSVAASGNSYVTNPITDTGVVNAAKTISAAFAAKPVSANNYDYTAGYQGGAGATVTITQNTAIVNPKTAVITTNFAPTVAGNCFTSTWGGVTSTTKAIGSSYQTTVTANDSTDWSGKVTPGYLNLAVGCGLSGGATVLSGVEYGIVSGVSIDGSTLNITQPCSSTSCKDPGNGKIISGYYPDWARYGKKFPLSKVPFANMNEVLYAFIGFNPATGDVKSLDAWADQNEMPTLSKAMLQYPYMHATLSFGGWTNAGATTAPMFAQLTSSDASIANFTKQSVAAMRAAGYDGIDIDWEWWSDYSVAPAAAQIKLYTSLRNALNTASQQDGKKYRLTIAVVAGLDKIQATETAVPGAWKTIAGLVDNINVMAYDMHGAFDAISDFQAPWGMEANSPHLATKYDIQDAMNAYVGYGVPSSKLVLGVPAYGRSMKVASLNNYGLYQTVTGVPSGDNDDASSGATGVFLYNCIINSAACNSNGSTIAALTFVNQGSATFNQLSSQAQEPWAYGATPQGNIFLTYDNVATATFKTQKVKANGYGGVMVWEIDGDAVDNPTMSLINAMKTELNK